MREVQRLAHRRGVGSTSRAPVPRLAEERFDVLAVRRVEVHELPRPASPARPEHGEPTIAQAQDLDRPVDLVDPEAANRAARLVEYRDRRQQPVQRGDPAAVQRRQAHRPPETGRLAIEDLQAPPLWRVDLERLGRGVGDPQAARSDGQQVGDAQPVVAPGPQRDDADRGEDGAELELDPRTRPCRPSSAARPIPTLRLTRHSSTVPPDGKT